jgi:hypothetical protein
MFQPVVECGWRRVKRAEGTWSMASPCGTVVKRVKKAHSKVVASESAFIF